MSCVSLSDATTRWWVLFLYSYVSGLQSLLWMTWSSVPDASKAYLGVSDSTLDLYLNAGPIMYCVSVFAAAWVLLARPDGIRISIKAGAGLCFVASAVRCVPALLPAGMRSSSIALASVYIGQFLNAAVAPLVVASPSYLSLVWFPEERRNLATAVGNVANALGRGIGFFLGPALVAGQGDLPKLLAVEVVLAALPFIGAMLYLPALPREPPSAAAAEEFAKLNSLRDRGKSLQDAGYDEMGDVPVAGDGLAAGKVGLLADGGGATGSGRVSFLASLSSAVTDFQACLRSPGLVLLTISGGMQMAVYGAWSGTLPSVLSARFSNGQAGALGSVNTFAGCIGGLLVAAVTDHPLLRRSLKTTTMALCVASSVVFGVLALALGPAAIPAVSDSLGFGALVVLCGLAGMVRGGADPLFFELSAELVHPTPAGTAGGECARRPISIKVKHNMRGGCSIHRLIHLLARPPSTRFRCRRAHLHISPHFGRVFDGAALGPGVVDGRYGSLAAALSGATGARQGGVQAEMSSS